MNVSMNISKTGMTSQQRALDAISHNIANVNTDGYKAKTTSFRALMNNEITEQDVLLNEDNQPSAITAGVRSDVTGTDFRQGSLTGSSRNLQLAIAGEGFFGVEDASGQFQLTRDGSFTRNGFGQIVNGNGDRLMMQTIVPPTQWPVGPIAVAEDGTVSIQGEEGTVQVGNVPVYLPENDQQLVAVGENKYILADGEAPIAPGGRIQQQFIEASNVNLADEMTSMMVAQRAYSLNVKVAQSTDELMTMINQFNR
ncbi:flagellar hook-basal body protein [Atopococcus tabaci]|uniref:flagellar hook-basal body protein n=1 Tax=Atopococcus tabaci TaxID=269774 RepID=UPI0004067115|nr:flagellar hook basal-body protein [Atopococcus tabaci]